MLVFYLLAGADSGRDNLELLCVCVCVFQKRMNPYLNRKLTFEAKPFYK